MNDQHGRMTWQKAKLGDGAEVACAGYEYNSLGQLCKTAVPGYEVERSYNIRGALRSISSPVYEETLWYEDGTFTPNLTGRIGERDFHLYGDRRRSYHYTYDGMGRLVNANSRDDQEHSWGRFLLMMAFDRNSNITHILRNGVQARDVYGIIDYADISYDGNRLLSVTDNADPVNLETSLDIPSGEYGEGTFDYDANGNLTADMTRNITEIVYSPMNNPLRISFGDGRCIDYVYSADGVKLEATEPAKLMALDEEITPLIPGGKQKVRQPVLMDRRSYTGSFELRNGALSRYNVATGYFDGNGKYYNSVADYQGNIVAVTSEDGEGSFNIYQLNAYYPDGMPYAAEAMINGGAKPVLSQLEANRYKYSGKELTTTFGADFYDFEARMRFIGLPMFGSIDPRATDYQHLTPYNFCCGDPVNCVDPTGESAEVKCDEENHTIVVRSHFYIYGKNVKNDVVDMIINSILDVWDTGQTIKINGVDYSITYELTGEIVTEAEAAYIAECKSTEKDNFVLYGDMSDGKGSRTRTTEDGGDANCFVFDSSDEKSPTTFAHEYGHGLGLSHPIFYDVLEKDVDIMTPRGTRVLTNDGLVTLDPNTRRVTKTILEKAFFTEFGTPKTRRRRNKAWNMMYLFEQPRYYYNLYAR